MKLTITKQQLKEAGACDEGLRTFAELFGDQAECDWTLEKQLEVLHGPLGRYVGWAYRAGLLPLWSLSGANLSGANLSGADLSRANLSRANLSGADLSRADLFEADLSRANLSGANLSGADLSRANLSRANLSRADLSGADLFEADLSGAVSRWTSNDSTAVLRRHGREVIDGQIRRITGGQDSNG